MMREMQCSLAPKYSDNNNAAQMSGTKLVSIIEENEQCFFYFARAHMTLSHYMFPNFH